MRSAGASRCKHGGCQHIPGWDTKKELELLYRQVSV